MNTLLILLFVIVSLAVIASGVSWGVDVMKARDFERKCEKRWAKYCEDAYDEKADE